MKKEALLVKLADKKEPTQLEIENACTAKAFLMGFALFEMSKTFRNNFNNRDEREEANDNFIVLERRNF